MALRDEVYQRKQRNSPTRERNPVVFMAAEGKNKTERLYFSDFARDVRRTVKFIPGGNTDPINMIRELHSFLSDNEFSPDLGDKAFCLVDADINSNKNNTLSSADKMSAKNGIQLIVSVPCFEIWYICHFVCSAKRYQSNAEVVSSLRKYIVDYKKGMPEVYSKIKDKTSIAIKNAKHLEQELLENGYKTHKVEFTPSSEAYKIAEELLK